MEINEPVFFPLSYIIIQRNFTEKTLKNSIWLYISGVLYAKDKSSVKIKTNKQKLILLSIITTDIVILLVLLF